MDTFTFFRIWISNPLRVAAVAPSGSALAGLMTKELSAESGPVLELGPGTGVFTRALLAQGLRECDLTLIEHDSGFANLLRLRFPAAHVHHADAARLARSGLLEDRVVGGVVSGLPLLSMSQRKVMAILSGTFDSMRPGASFYQFTYGPNCPVPHRILDRLGLKATRIGRTLLNVPPASVYRISRRSPRRQYL
ncbi:class I SAM-dependent methyltransferase [Pseudoxanthomonas sacheonensis]|uniref:class I SAM-dependent methyltransferase n=1 Tax=Pseudoxanthomonas sacheonensis TaxID=443615 RepID=UPI001FE8707F|nr:rRNA adenine N-6-methyltransferase family protein [Pseudoxanthomonas sacheonensis]